MKISIVLGTRPEIIKMSPIIRESERLGLDYQVIHTGQHYSHEMHGVFFEELELPRPEYNLGVGLGDHGEQTERNMIGLEPVLVKEKPCVVLVEGDTNSVVAGAITAAKLHIRVGRVEAGLRSYDRMMPEEINRVVADHVSDYLFAPTKVSEQNLLREGVDANKIFVTGNTVVGAIHQNMEISKRKSDVLDSMGFVSMGMFTRGFLEEIRLKAIRRRVLYSALDGVERGILYLCTRVVDEVSSPVLGVQLVEIVSRLREAMKSAFTRHVESYGFKRVVQLVEQASSMGYDVGSEWLHDMGFVRYLAVLHMNQPIGYRI